MIVLTRQTARITRHAPLARCPGVATMLEVERLRALAEQVRMQLIQRCIDRGVNAQGERVIVLDYDLGDLLYERRRAEYMAAARRGD